MLASRLRRAISGGSGGGSSGTIVAPPSSARPQQRQRQRRHQQLTSAAAAAAGDGDSGATAGPTAAGSASSDDGASVSSGGRFLRYNKDLPLRHHSPENAEHLAPGELPERLRDLSLNDDGLLVDGRGQVVNGLGATRFDVAVAALRGDLDPKPWEDNTERAPGVIMQSLVQFPCAYTFQVVGASAKATGSSGNGSSGTDSSSSSGSAAAAAADDDAALTARHADFVADVAATVSRMAEVSPLPDGSVVVTPRLKGKFVSVKVTVTVRAAEVILAIADELKRDARVKMAF